MDLSSVAVCVIAVNAHKVVCAVSLIVHNRMRGAFIHACRSRRK